jgi:hypothetical protein
LFKVVEQQLNTNICCTINQFIFPIHTTVILVPLAMVIVVGNVLWIPLPKFHDGDDAIIHIGRLTKICVTNSEAINAHKLEYFPTTLWRKNVSWFIHYETTNHPATWGEVQCAFISKFNNVHSKRQAIVALREMK